MPLKANDLAKKKKSHINLSLVTFHMSPVANANNQRPFPCYLPYYAQYGGPTRQNINNKNLFQNMNKSHKH